MYSAIDSNKRRTYLLIGLFIVFIGFLGWTIDWYLEGGGVVTVFAILFSMISALVSYYAGDKVALSVSGAKQIQKTDAPELWRLVENLCIANGQPMPKVYIIQDPTPNAFATGRSPEHASVAFTTGLIERLNRTELEGVVAHELSHIKNYDIRTMTIVVVLVGTVALMTDLFLRMSFYGGRRRDSKGGGGILLIIGLVFLILAPIIAQIIKLAVSRQREYLADASGALLTRYPEGLASALEKISAANQPLKRASTATAHMYISNPFGKKKSFFTGLFSTHPPAEQRIAKLRSMISKP